MSAAPNQPRIVVGAASRSASTREKLLALMLLFLVGVLSAILTRAWTLAGTADARAQMMLLEAKLDASQAHLGSLGQQLAIAQRGDQVTRGANDELRNEIVRLQNESAELRTDIEFYQRLLGAGGTRDGLAVHGLQLNRTTSPLVYRYELTLSQNLKKARIVSGQVELFIDGVDGDRPRTLDVLKMNSGSGDADLGFEFKYFQLLRGSFGLPEGFVAERIRVHLVPRKGRVDKSLWKDFEWSELLQTDTDTTNGI